VFTFVFSPLMFNYFFPLSGIALGDCPVQNFSCSLCKGVKATNDNWLSCMWVTAFTGLRCLSSSQRNVSPKDVLSVFSFMWISLIVTHLSEVSLFFYPIFSYQGNADCSVSYCKLNNEDRMWSISETKSLLFLLHLACFPLNRMVFSSWSIVSAFNHSA
jgi:hypothetical protein